MVVMCMVACFMDNFEERPSDDPPVQRSFSAPHYKYNASEWCFYSTLLISLVWQSWPTLLGCNAHQLCTLLASILMIQQCTLLTCSRATYDNCIL